MRGASGEKIVKLIWSMIALVALLLSLLASAQAAGTIDVSKLTCKEALFGRYAIPKAIAYWVSGYYNGAANNTMIDVRAFDRNADKLGTYCRAHRDTPVLDAAKAVFGK
jgi:hypothetical protein